MADFCNQCAKELGFPEGDLARPDCGPPGPGMGYPELCEGCGPTLVDEKGNCIDPHCDLLHGCTAKAEEIMTAFVAECKSTADALPMLHRIATELCGTQYAFDITQLHDEYTVMVRSNS